MTHDELVKLIDAFCYELASRNVTPFPRTIATLIAAELYDEPAEAAFHVDLIVPIVRQRLQLIWDIESAAVTA